MIKEVNIIPYLANLVNLLSRRVETGAGEDEFNLIVRSIELINERRPVFYDEEQDVFYVAADEKSRAPYRVTAQSCTCPRADEDICKHRLLVAAIKGIEVNTSGFEYTRRKRVPKQQEALIAQ